MATMPPHCVRPSLVNMPTPASYGEEYTDPAFEPSNAFTFDDDAGVQDDDALSSLDRTNPLHSDVRLHAALQRSSKAEFPSSAAPRGRGKGIAALGAVLAEPAKRSTTVAQQFGQITPLDDDIVTRGMLDVALDQESQLSVMSVEDAVAPCSETPSSKAGMSSRSERARNAANHRHSKSKPVKRESLSAGDEVSEPDENGQTDHKREKYREKNRVAAAKCRAKKKTNSDHLEGSARDTERENTRLKLEERKLRDELTRLKEASLAHHPHKGPREQ